MDTSYQSRSKQSILLSGKVTRLFNTALRPMSKNPLLGLWGTPSSKIVLHTHLNPSTETHNPKEDPHSSRLSMSDPWTMSPPLGG